jgi:ABC-type transport system substrate-binding protein
MTTLRNRAAWLRAIPVVLAAALLAACGGGDGASPTGDTSGRTVLRLAYDREIDVLNAFTSQNLVDIQFSMVEGLVTTDDHNTYIPVLAKEIPTEENGLVVRNADGTVTMTWPLQEGVRWHDGEPFTSTDVCFTWKFVTSPASQVCNRHEYLGITGCAMPDDHTVVFTWSGEYGYYHGLFEAILPEHVLRGKTTEEIVNYTPYNRGTELVGTDGPAPAPSSGARRRSGDGGARGRQCAHAGRNRDPAAARTATRRRSCARRSTPAARSAPA